MLQLKRCRIFIIYFKTEADRDRFIKRTDDLVWQWTDEGKLKLQPGVQEALDEFEKRGLKMAIASSNYENVVQHAMWATGIRNYFDFHLSYLDVQRGHIKAKPAPDIYLEAAKKMNLPKENILVFKRCYFRCQRSCKCRRSEIWCR